MFRIVGVERRAGKDGKIYVSVHLEDFGEDLNEGGHRVQTLPADPAAIPSLVAAMKAGALVVLDERKVRYGDVERSIIRRAVEVPGV